MTDDLNFGEVLRIGCDVTVVEATSIAATGCGETKNY